MPKQYIATQPLDVGTARAHNIGDEVPFENIERNGWQDGTAAVGTKAAEAAVSSATEPQGLPEPSPPAA